MGKEFCRAAGMIAQDQGVELVVSDDTGCKGDRDLMARF